MSASRWRLLIVALSSLAFLWPAVLNGGPFLFSDSVQYIRSPDGAIAKLFGPAGKSEWSRPRPVAPGTPTLSGQDLALASVPRSGRSIYYGVLANIGARTGGFWLTMVLQALCAALSIDLLCRAIGWMRARTYLLAVAVAALLSPLAVYACFVMPDLFVSVLVLVAAALAAGADRLSRSDLGVGAGLIAYSAATHTSHLAVLAAIAAAAVVVCVLRREDRKRRAPWVRLALVSVASLVIAIAAGAAFNMMVKKAYGAPLTEVPFLTARMISEHHPGESWLKRHCPDAGFVACKFTGRLPLTGNEFLWSADPVKSAFNTASIQDQIALGKEQTRLFLAIARQEPLPVARYFMTDWIAQLGTFSLDGMNVNEEQRIYLDSLFPDDFRSAWRKSLGYRQGWPSDAMTLGLGVLVVASLASIVGLGASLMATAQANRSEEEERLVSAALIVIVGVLANAAVCGGLSGVFGRYEARVLPSLILAGSFCAALLLARVQRRSI